MPPEITDPDEVADAQDCFRGLASACDDLFAITPIDSVGETYGKTCAGRITEAEGDAFDCVELLFAADDLPALWPRADVVVIAAPATDRTRHLVDRRVLAALPRHAVIVNVARGSLIDTDALVEALRAHEIAGAALDVTDPEPLPPGHPLWELDTALVTPHNANPEIAWKANVARRVAENLRRYRAGDELVGVIDLLRSY